VLSFQNLQCLYTASQLTTHRIVNTLTHVAAGRVFGLLAIQLALPITTQLAITQKQQTRRLSSWMPIRTKPVFCLHPTHVEVRLPRVLRIATTLLSSCAVAYSNIGGRRALHLTTVGMFVSEVHGFLKSNTNRAYPYIQWTLTTASVVSALVCGMVVYVL
jgi:hypothetical protein